MAKQSQSEIDQMIQRSKYRNRDLVRRDIIELIQLSECNLILNLIPFYSPDGIYREYLCLSGTIICLYKGNSYHIPIEIQIHEDHPYQPPIIQVKPTANMYISTANENILSDGTFTHQQIKSWKHPNSRLSNIIRLMSQSFSQSPPLYSISSNVQIQRTQYPSDTNQRTPYPIDNSLVSMPMPMPMSMSTGLNTHESICRRNENEHGENVYYESLKRAILDKVRDRYYQIIEKSNEEINSLNQIQEDFNQREIQLNLFINQIQQQQQFIQKNSSLLTSEKSNKCSLKSEGLKLEDLIIISNPISKQLFNCYLEDHAIEDFLFYLSYGLKNKSISLQNYLKYVSQLSRKQFLLRAKMIDQSMNK